MVKTHKVAKVEFKNCVNLALTDFYFLYRLNIYVCIYICEYINIYIEEIRINLFSYLSRISIIFTVFVRNQIQG